jgi:hypothetical protein
VVLVLDVVVSSTASVELVELSASVVDDPWAGFVVLVVVVLVDPTTVVVAGPSVVVDAPGSVVDGAVVVVVDDSWAIAVPTDAPTAASTTSTEGRSLFVIVRPAMEPGTERTEG